MITARGWQVVGAALAGFALALLTLNYILILVALAIFVFLVSDLIGFHLTVPRLRASMFEVERAPAPRRIPAGYGIPISVRVTYHGARGFWGELFDVVPSRCPAIDGRVSIVRWWAPGESVDLSYVLSVPSRGEYKVGPAVILAVGPLGLGYVRAVLPGEQTFLGVPTGPLRRPSVASNALHVRMRGSLHLRQRGYGTEVRSLRPYQGDDDIRHVAWRRSTPEQLIVREYDQEGRQDFLLVYDTTPRMGAGEAGATALDIAAEVGWLLAGLVERSGEDRLGVATPVDDPPGALPPGRGRLHYAAIEERLARLSTREGSFDLARVLSDLAARLESPAHVFVFSATDPTAPGLAPAYRRFLQHGHRLSVFTPEISRLFEPGPHPEAGRWARRYEDGQLHDRLRRLRAGGIPVVVYDRRNANTKLLNVYGRVRAWGRAT